MADGLFALDLGSHWECAPRAELLPADALPRPLAPWQPIRVPGCWEAQGFGYDLTGPVLYRARFILPHDWPSNATTLLCCEAVSYATRVWLDSRFVGAHEGMWDAFELSLAELMPASTHELLIAVERHGSRYPVRETPAGFLPDLGVLFGGLWQPVSLRAVGPLILKRAVLLPLLHDQLVDITFLLENQIPGSLQAEVQLRLRDAAGDIVVAATLSLGTLAAGTIQLTHRLPLDELHLWAPDNPYRYTLEAELFADGVLSDRLVQQVGLRELRVAGDQILLNGEPLYLRGILNWGYDERRRCPTPSDDELRAELEQLKALGFNLVKHCLYVPPRRTLELADEMGMLSWIELPLWLPHMNDALRQRLRTQYPRIVAQRADHPSLIIWTLGCELNASVDGPLLTDLFQQVRAALPGAPATSTLALLRDNSGSGECYGGLATDSADFYDYHFYCDPPFLPALVDAFASSYRPRRPWLFGECNDSDTWRSLDELSAAWRAEPSGQRGWWLHLDWQHNPHIQQHDLPLATQPQVLAAYGLHDLDHQGLRLRSNRHAELLRKLTIERTRLYQEVSGYVVTVLRDQPICISGLFDDLGRLKVDPLAFSQFNAEAVLLLAWDLRRTWRYGGDRLLRRDAWGHWAGSVLRPHIVLANHGRSALGGQLDWQLRNDGGQVWAAGNAVCLQPVASGEVQEVAMVELNLPAVQKPQRFWLQVALAGANLKNAWPLWVYPQPNWLSATDWLGIYGSGELAAQAAELLPKAPWGSAALAAGRVVLATRWDEALADYVAQGAAVLLAVPPDDPELAVRRVPFWREAVKEALAHSAWGDFLQDEIVGLQLYGATTDYALDPLVWRTRTGVTSYTPILRRFDARRYEPLDYLAELRVGAGCVIAATLRWQAGLGDCPSGLAQHTSAQALLWQLLAYLRAYTGEQNLSPG